LSAKYALLGIAGDIPGVENTGLRIQVCEALLANQALWQAVNGLGAFWALAQASAAAFILSLYSNPSLSASSVSSAKTCCIEKVHNISMTPAARIDCFIQVPIRYTEAL
jgi:hypothetical protein